MSILERLGEEPRLENHRVVLRALPCPGTGLLRLKKGPEKAF